VLLFVPGERPFSSEYRGTHITHERSFESLVVHVWRTHITRSLVSCYVVISININPTRHHLSRLHQVICLPKQNAKIGHSLALLGRARARARRVASRRVRGVHACTTEEDDDTCVPFGVISIHVNF
jgi:hypothetical protein